MHSSDLPGQPFLGNPFPEPSPAFLESCAESRAEDLCEPEPASGSDWRAEVASRVSDYRSRHQRSRHGDHASALPLDLEAAEPMAAQIGESVEPLAESSYPVPAITECPSAPPRHSGDEPLEFATEFTPGELSPHALARLAELRDAVRGTFDTTYYRRRNLENLRAAAAECEAEPALSPLDLDLQASTAGDACLERYRIAEPAPETESFAEPQPDEPSPEHCAGHSEAAAQGNLIIFPSSLLEPPLFEKPSREELAEPVRQRPRILEVPEDIIPAVQGSLFPEIRLDGEESEGDASREAEPAVPLPVAPLLSRLQAALLDSAAVAGAGALFASLARRGLPGVPHDKTFWLAMAGVTAALWVVYQRLFLLYAGRTPGMALLGLELATFDGERPDWRRRGRRVRFLLISVASVMLGNLWALLDKDMLCWHDRLSQTFPTRRMTAQQEPE